MFKNILTFLCLCACGYFALFFAQTYVADRALRHVLTAAGYNKPIFRRTNADPRVARYGRVVLSSGGEIVAYDVQIFFRFKFNKIKQPIDKIKISRIESDIVFDRFAIFDYTIANLRETLSETAEIPIEIDNITGNIGTNLGDIRLQTPLRLRRDGDGQVKIEAHLRADQYQLGLDMPIMGTLSPKIDERFAFEMPVRDGHLEFGPLRIARVNGWLAVSGAKTLDKIDGVINAGAARLFTIPFQDPVLTMQSTEQGRHIILRSGITGLPRVEIAADIDRTHQTGEMDAQITALFPDDTLKNFFSLLNIKYPTTLPPLRIRADYMQERRFKGGPVPFALTLSNLKTGKATVEGTILYYPDTGMIRGSLFGDADLVKFIRSAFSLTGQSGENSAIIDLSLKEIIANNRQKSD